MKILMLTTNSSLLDGINRHILTVAPAINKQGDCEVAVCTVFPRAELAEELETQGVKTYSLNAVNGHDRKILTRFYKVMRDFNPDIVHAHVMAMFERIVLATFFSNKRFIKTIHGINTTTTKKTFKVKFERFINRCFTIKYSSLCVVSNGVREHYFKNNKNNISTVYNPLSFGEVSPKRYKLHGIIGVDSNSPIIGTACRIANVKNPIAFTRVMAKVLQLNENVHAVVMGDGKEVTRETLQQIVDEANISDRFHWLGYRQDAPELVRDLNCFVMTSISEGMPTSILESMANKTPFAMMEGMGGLKDIAEINENEGPIGIVVPKDDIEGMAKGICSLLQNPEQQEQLAENAYIVGKKHFDVESVSKQLHDVYKEVLI